MAALQIYSGQDFTLEIDGAEPACLTGVQVSENQDLTPGQRDLVGWEVYRANHHGLRINLEGVDLGGYTQLLAKFNAGVIFPFTLSSYDGNIVEVGDGYLLEVTRSEQEGEYRRFTAVVVAVGPVQNTTRFSYLLLENGDYLLLESGDKILN